MSKLLNMGPIEFNKRRIFVLVGAIFAFYILFHGLSYTGNDVKDVESHIPIPNHPTSEVKTPPTSSDQDRPDETSVYPEPTPLPTEIVDDSPPTLQRFDDHPITRLMQEA